MKTKTIYLLALVMALILSSGAPSVATAEDAVVPFKATYNMSPRAVGVTEDGCNIQELPGEGQATHLGMSSFYSNAFACPAALVQFGDMLFTAANGDQLFGGFSGSLEFAPDFSSVRFWGDYWITGGSGRFEGVTGSGHYWGTAQLSAEAKGILHLSGTLTK